MLGGLQRTISQVILRYAQNYLVNIDTDLNLSLWSGDVVLKAVELRLDVLQSLVGYRGYRIDKAVVAELRIHVPWISLTTSSVRITLKGVECAATLDDSLTRPPEGNGHNAPSSPPESKPQIDIEDTTSNEAEQEDGWTKALIGKIIANARVEISDISLRLTGASCQGFVILEAVTLKPADENWVPSYIEPSGPWRMIHALLEVEHLSIGIVEGKSEIVEGKSEIAEHLLDDYVIRDFDAVLRIRTYQSPGVRWIKSNSLAIPSEPCGPRLLVSFLVDSAVEICLSPDKLRMLISLAPLASSGAAHETVTPLDTLMLPSDIGSSAEVVHINFDAKPAEAMKQRKVSWGNWAWDLLAVPPSDLESAIDIGHLAPTKGAVASCDIRSLTITLSKTHRPPLNVSPSKPRSSFLSSPVSNAAFASVTGRSISVHVSIGENNDVRNVSSFLTFSSFAVINQMTALPLFLIAEEVDVCEVMPFIGTSDEQDVGIDAGVPFRTLAQMHPNQETPRPTFSLLFQRRPHKPDTVALRCSSIGAMVPLKSNADTDFIQNLVPFVTLQKSRRLDSDTDHLLEENQATSAHVNVSVDIRRLSLSLHVDDVGDWKHEELFLPAANTLSFQMFSVLFTNDPTSGKRVSFRKCYTQAHDVSLEYRRWRGSRSIDGLLFSMTDASFQNAGFTVESAEMSVSFRHFHFIVLLSMAVCCAWDSLSLSSNIRLQVAALRPRRSLLPQSVLLSHAVLHFHLGGLVVHASKSCTLRTLSASVNRRNQTRLVVFPHPAASDAAPAVDLRFSGRNATSVKSIPMSVVIDSFFLDVLAFATVYRQVIPGSTGDATGSSPTSPSFVTEVMSAIHHLDVDIAPVTFIIPLSDAYHISRRASLFGYRNCSTLCIQLPSVRITKSDVSSIMLDDISVFTIPNTVGPALWRTIANSRSFILEPVGIRCSVIGLSQINVAIDTPVKVSLDEKQASAIKLATAAILPSARSGDHKHLPRKCDAVVHPAHISDVRSIVSVALTLQTIELHTHETSSFSASRMGRTPIDSVRFDVHGLKVSGSVHCGPGAPVCTRLEADVDDVLIAYWCAHRHHQMMTSDGGSLTMERCDGGDALCSVSIRPISALINIDALLSAFAVLELATVKNGDLLSNANGSAGRHSSAQAPSSICINCQIGTVQAGVIAGPSASICVMFDDIDFTRSVGASFKIRENVSIRRLHCFVSEMTTLPASCSEAISSAVDLQVERTGMRIKCQVPPLSLRVTENLLSLVSQVSSKMPSTPSSDTAATGLFSQDDLRSLQVVVLTATDNCRRPRPGEVILSPLSIAWRYVAPRAVTTISVHAGNIIAAGGQLTLSVSAFDDTGRVFRSVDEFVADFGRSLCHNMPETVAGADEWRITFADPNYDAEEVAHLLRIDSRSDLFIQTTLSLSIPIWLLFKWGTRVYITALRICLVLNSPSRAATKSPLSAMMYEFRHADRAVSLRFDTPLVVNIDSLIVDTLSHIAEQFSLVNATASIPADTGEGSVIVELQRQSTGSVVVSVSPPASILNTTLSPLVMLTGGDRDRHQRSLAVKPLESDSLELPHDSCVPLFWSDASTRRFSLADLSAFVVSPSLHCRRSGEFPIDLCSAVALSVTRLSLTVVWETSRTRGDTFDECSHCRITIQPRYVVHNRCPFPIRFQQGEQMPVKQLENEDHRPLSSWPLSSPPIDVIRRGVDFEKGLGVEDLSKLRISLPTYRVAEDTGDEWGWSQEILLSQGGGRRHHLRVRNRVFGYDQLLSYFIIAHDSVSHLIIFRDEQVPYTIVNATSSRITYRALPDACRDDPLSPQSPTVMPLEVAPGLSSQFCGPRDRSNLSTDPEERIFNSGEWNGMYPCYLHLRTPGSQWVSAENAVPLLPGTTRLVHLVSNLHDPEPHMIDSFDHKRRVSSDEERTLQVDVFERFGTTIAVVAPPGQLERVAFGRKIPCDFLSVSIPTIQFNFRDWNDTVFRVSIDGLGVDVAHDTPQSSLLLFRSMSYLEEGAISPCRNLRLRAESFQVDHLRSHEYPVIAHSVKGDARCALSVVCSWSPFIRFDGSDLSLLASPLHMVLSKPDLRSLSLSLSSMHLNLEDAFVASAMAYGTRFIEDVFRKGADSTTASLDSPDWRGNPEFLALLSKITSPRFFAHILDISPVHISLSFSSSRTYLDTNQTPLHFAPIVLRSVLSSQERLIKELSACYLADTIIRSPMLLGSLDLIGNPTQVVSSISKGIHDLVTLPTRALTQGPRAFAWAAMQGVGSLIQHISEGTLMSVSGFTHSLAGNMDRLSQDQYQLNSTPRRFGGRSFATGVTQLVNGVFLGVTGVVTAPIRGAAQQGSWGFVKGCGIGMAGVVTKPMSGALQLVSHTSRGLASSAGLSYVMPDVRPPLNDDSSGSTLDCISYIRLRIMCNRVGEKYCEHFLCGPVVQGSSQLSNRALIVCTSVGVHVIVNDGTDKPFMSFDHPSVDIIGQSVRISDADNTIDVEISGLHRTRLINRIQCFR
ncbi:unnamed protein product (mitochondrion) [Plasmodiophora brassicae]|uniref:Chorein N-terminal domain-containing protein n=1 Tax=Plasmodiophora brassicae TaxID=37360 RepID=A0A3P3YB14_PLABS|nr:unnamed protein product [Plasmodiophora brassicae]